MEPTQKELTQMTEIYNQKNSDSISEERFKEILNEIINALQERQNAQFRIRNAYCLEYNDEVNQLPHHDRDEPHNDQALHSLDRMKIIFRNGIKQLPEKDNTILRLRYALGLIQNEVAFFVNSGQPQISTALNTTIINRLIRKLRNHKNELILIFSDVSGLNSNTEDLNPIDNISTTMKGIREYLPEFIKEQFVFESIQIFNMLEVEKRGEHTSQEIARKVAKKEFPHIFFEDQKKQYQEYLQNLSSKNYEKKIDLLKSAVFKYVNALNLDDLNDDDLIGRNL